MSGIFPEKLIRRVLKLIQAALVVFIAVQVSVFFQRQTSFPTRAKLLLAPARPVEYYEKQADRKLLAELKALFGDRSWINVSNKERKLKQKVFSVFKQTSFPKLNYGVVLVFYKPGREILKFSSNRPGVDGLWSVLWSAANHARLANYVSDGFMETRIQLDFIMSKPRALNLDRISSGNFSEARFEMGVDGLIVNAGGLKKVFLPGDAYVESVLTIAQLRRRLAAMFPNIPARDFGFRRFQSESYLSYENKWLRLYRGYPLVSTVSKDGIDLALEAAVNFVIKNQRSDGSFIYYYDPYRDSFTEYDRSDEAAAGEAYYNILRHIGGAIALLEHFELKNRRSSLDAAKLAIEFLVKHIAHYRVKDSVQAAYVICNRKGKLGGSGLALHLLSKYYQLTRDEQFNGLADQILNHLQDQILESGEFIYYYTYLDKRVSAAENSQLFNFYYPGEALIGLGSYLKYRAEDAAQRERLQSKIHQALHFLIHERPKRYRGHFLPLPSDSWLMMAINELWDVPEMRSGDYSKFVFKDADTMIDHSYTETNALYPDYKGSYFYVYGDFPYADAARAEGLTAALALAVKVGDGKRVQRYRNSLEDTVLATYRLVNTAQSTYSVRRPALTVGAIRFKHVRQWWRIDSIQHVVSFYIKFWPFWESHGTVMH